MRGEWNSETKCNCILNGPVMCWSIRNITNSISVKFTELFKKNWRKSWMSRQHVSHNASNALQNFYCPLCFTCQVKSRASTKQRLLLTWPLSMSFILFHFLPLSFSCISFYVFLFCLVLPPSPGYVPSTSTSAIGLPFARLQTSSCGIKRNVKNLAKEAVYKFFHVPCDSLSNATCFRFNKEEQTRRCIRKFSAFLK